MDLPRDRDPTATVKSNFSLSSRGIWSIGFQSNGVGNSWKNTTIAVRSNRDRGAIEPRSWILPPGINPQSSIGMCWRIWSMIDARSWSDCGRSWSIAAKIVARKKRRSWQKLRPIHGQSRSYNVAPRNRSHDLEKLPPRPLHHPRFQA